MSHLSSLLVLSVTGAFLGLGYAAFFSPSEENLVADILKGVPLGLFAWVLLPLNLFPLFMGTAPVWTIGAVTETLPLLIAYVLIACLAGYLYCLACRWLDGPLGLSQIEQKIPPIQSRIVILGGGYAGVAAAEKLEQAFERDASVGIWLVSSTNYLLHTPMLSEVSASAVNAQHISPSLRSSFRRVQVVQSAVESVDVETQQVFLKPTLRASAPPLTFDHLIVAVGSVPNFFGNESIEQNCLTFKSLDDAVLLRNQIIDTFERADLEKDPERRKCLLTFVVAGGGFAGVELIGSINDFVRGISVFYPNIEPEDVRLVLVHSRETILPELSLELGKYARQKLQERGVEFLLNRRVTGAEPGRVLLGEESIDTETFIWTAGNRPSPILSMLGVPLSERGQLPTNEHLAVVHSERGVVEGLWAVGDCAQIPDAYSRSGFAPPTAQHALREGKVAGHNVAATLRGRPLKKFAFKTLGSLAALGHQVAVAEIFGYRFSGLFAWIMWRAIYLSKLPTLQKRIRVGIDWAVDIFFPPDIVQTIDFSREDLHGPGKRRELS